MELKRIFDCLYYQWENHPLDTCLARKYKGKWVYFNHNKTEELDGIAGKLTSLWKNTQLFDEVNQQFVGV